MKLSAFLSYRVAIRRKSFRRPNMRSVTLTTAIAFPVEGIWLLAIGLVGDDRLALSPYEPSPPVVRVIGLVGEQIFRRRKVTGEHHGSGDVGNLAGCQVEGQGAAILVAYGVDLGVAPTFGATDGLNRSPPFPPPAQRWALTWVLSTEISPGVPARVAINSANRYCQMPFCDQRL